MPATLTVLDESVREALPTIQAHAAACGRLDCGHLGRSTSLAVRRAVILYQAEGAGIDIDLDGEAPEVAAVVGVLRDSQHARPMYIRAGRSYARTVPGMTQVLPDARAIKITQQRLEVFTAMLKGYSANQIATAQHRALETVKSHSGWLRRLTGGHDATSCLIALVLAGKLSDQAMPVEIEDDEEATA